MSGADVLRPAPTGPRAKLVAFGLEHIDPVFRLLRTVFPILRLGKNTIVTRYDDVREAFLTDDSFAVPYAAKLDVIMGGQPFFLGMGDTPDYRRDTAAMRKAVRREDVHPRLTSAFAERAAAAVAAAGGEIEVVDGLARTVTFDVLCDYFGVGNPPGQDLKVITTRLFEFQFADPGNDPALRREVDIMAPQLRSHVDATIAERRRSGKRVDDVLGRCLDCAAAGEPGFSDLEIRSALIGFLVGGLPQPPMVVPQALEQLLRRGDALAGAQAAARADDDRLLAGYVFEALRFDPLAPGLMRTVVKDHTVAAGTARATTVPSGGTLMVAFRSAMMDGRRIADPQRFDPQRLPHEYMHFGHGLHTCFGIHINQAVLPLMLKPLLKAAALKRAPGARGRLTKRGAFADRLWVQYSR